jgi:hypothetical protein
LRGMRNAEIKRRAAAERQIWTTAPSSLPRAALAALARDA